MWSLKSPWKMVAIFCMNHGSVQFSLLFCHKDEQKTKFKYWKSQWRRSAREATGLVRNELCQLNYCNKILTELYMQKSMAELQPKYNLSTEWRNNIQWVLLGSLTIGWGNFPAMTVPYVSCSWQVLKKIEVFSSTLLKWKGSGKLLARPPRPNLVKFPSPFFCTSANSGDKKMFFRYRYIYNK